jgi:hypothetical protein
MLAATVISTQAPCAQVRCVLPIFPQTVTTIHVADHRSEADGDRDG